MEPVVDAIPKAKEAATGFRWEWRSFGQRFGRAEEVIGDLPAGEPKDSDEIYFLSSSGQNVKIRDGLLDVKILRKVNIGCLEQWAPLMKAQFPLSADDMRTALQALHVSVPRGLRDGLDLQSFLALLDDSEVRVVNVHKRRVRYTVGGCMAELSELSADGIRTRTIAVEAEDSSAVIEAVDQLRLGGYFNTNYPRGLQQLISHAPERYAVVDVGTNSVKFHIGMRGPSGSWRTVADRAELTRLGEGLAERGVISQAAADRTAGAIAGMIGEARRNEVRAIAAVGTAGLRLASNSGDVIAAIKGRTGLEVEVISGEEEARLAFVATTAALGSTSGSLVVFDTGGGSSQFTVGDSGHIEERFSVPVGAARYTDRFKLDEEVSREVLDRALAEIAKDLDRLDGCSPPDLLVGMGGAVTNITAVSLGLAEYDAKAVQGALISRDEIDRQIELYRSRDAASRRSIIGLQPKRAEVILAGACIVRTILIKFDKTSMQVSDRGLRHGLIAERFGDQG